MKDENKFCGYSDIFIIDMLMEVIELKSFVWNIKGHVWRNFVFNVLSTWITENFSLLDLFLFAN